MPHKETRPTRYCGGTGGSPYLWKQNMADIGSDALNEWIRKMKEKYGTEIPKGVDLKNVDEPILRDFKGIWIPKKIWLSKELTWMENLMLAEIDSLSTKNGFCTASNKYFSKFFNISERRVRQILESLKKKKRLEIVDFDGRIRYLKAII